MHDLLPPSDDGFPADDVGEWSRDKHHFLWRYLDAFTTAMKKKKWSGLHYVDLFAGSGVVKLRDSKKLDWGSPLLAAQAPHPFDCLHLCELDDRKYSDLSERIARLKPASEVQLLLGDANDRVQDVVQALPKNSLSLAFLDPYGLHLDFSTLRALAKRRVDLIIFFPDYLDALRNSEGVYRVDPNSNLDKVLGKGVDWRTVKDHCSKDAWAEELTKLYVGQIQSLGYSQFEYERISGRGRRFYRLIFCSHSTTGATIWRNVAKKRHDGQYTFGYGG